MSLLRRAVATVSTIGACCGSGSAAVTAPPQPLEPLTAWNLDYGETRCVALRDYGKSEGPVTFAIKPSPNGETYELVLARKHKGPQFAEELQGSVDFGSGPIKAWLLHYSSKDRKVELYQYRIPAAEIAQARIAKAVTFHVKGGMDQAFELATIPALLDGFQKCTEDLARYWNLGGERDGRIAVGSKGDVRSVFSARDYPWEALSRRQEGTAQFLLLIDEVGKVAGCHVLQASGVPALDAMGCVAIQERAKFTPARDDALKAVRSTYVTPPIVWRMGF
jgi:TonB family protein